MEMKEVTDKEEDEWIYETLSHPPEKSSAQTSIKKCISHVCCTKRKLRILMVLFMAAVVFVIFFLFKDITSVKIQKLEKVMKKQNKLANDINSRVVRVENSTSIINNQSSNIAERLKLQERGTMLLRNKTNDINSRVVRVENSTSIINNRPSNIAKLLKLHERGRLLLRNKVNTISTSLTQQNNQIQSLDTKVNTISTSLTQQNNRIQSLDTKADTVSTSLAQQNNRIQNLINKLSKHDAALDALKGCSWQIGEGSVDGSYSKNVDVGSSVTMNECIKLCIQKSSSYNGAFVFFH